jgi:hypothetical protein
LLPDWITPSVPLARSISCHRRSQSVKRPSICLKISAPSSYHLDAAVVAAAEELAVHQRHGPHVLVGVQQLGVAVPAEQLVAENKRKSAFSDLKKF